MQETVRSKSQLLGRQMFVEYLASCIFLQIFGAQKFSGKFGYWLGALLLTLLLRTTVLNKVNEYCIPDKIKT